MLLFRRELDHSSGFIRIPECGKDLSGDTKIGMAHVRALFGLGKRERNTAKVICVHDLPRQESYVSITVRKPQSYAGGLRLNSPPCDVRLAPWGKPPVSG